MQIWILFKHPGRNFLLSPFSTYLFYILLHVLLLLTFVLIRPDFPEFNTPEIKFNK